MRISLAAAAFIAPIVAVSAACDTAYLFGTPRKIVAGEGEGGEGEGEGVAGEGEGEGTAGEGEGEGGVGKVCGGTLVVTQSAPIAMTAERTRHAAALLKDGRVLVAGGNDAATQNSEKTAEIFDPAHNAFSATGSLAHSRIDFALVALDDGRAIAFGGFDNDPADAASGDLTSTEIWDPSTSAWTAGPDLPEPWSGMSAVKVAGGKVLVFGGQDNADSLPTEVVLFDPSNNTLSAPAGSVGTGRNAQTAQLLSDGRVLMVGGFFTASLANVDVVFPDGHAAPGADIPLARRSACAANDDAGKALVFGGYNGSELVDIESYDPASNQWSAAGSLGTGRAACEAVPMSCLDLVCGSFAGTTCDAWDFASKAAVHVLDDVGVDFDFTLTAIDDTHALLAGGTFNDFDVSQNAVVISLEPAP